MVISGSEKISPAMQKSQGSSLRWPRFSAGMTTMMIHATATTPASVGVKKPVRIPPSRITGIIIGSDASLNAYAISRNGARGRVMPAGPKK